MKKILLLLLTFIVCYEISNAQAPPRFIWLEGSASGGDGYGDGLKINRDTLFVYGRAATSLTIANLSIVPNGTVPYVGMFDTAGTTLNNGIWLSDNYSYSEFAYADALGIDKEDNSYITSCDGSGGAVYIQRYNRYGTSKWLSESPNSNCRGYGVAADNRGNLYASGNYSGSSITFGSTSLPYGGSAWAGYLVKMDTATGTFKWATYYDATGGSNNNYVAGGRCATDNQGNAYVVGTYENAPTFYSVSAPPYTSVATAADVNNFGNLFVAKYDSNGNVVWVISATNAGAGYNWYGYSPQIALDSCDNVYVAGVFENSATFGSITVNATNGSAYNMYLAKWNALAQQWEWVQTGLSPTTTSPGSLILDNNSDVYLAGTYASPFTIGDTTLNTGNTFVAKYANSTGSLLWVANGTSAGPGGIAVDDQKFVYIFGNINSNGVSFGPYSISGSGGNGSFFAKLDTFPVRTIVPVIDTTYCPGSTVIIPYTISGSFNSGNVFTAQLSNDSGSFINPTFLGSVTSNTSGTITITIPANTPQGSNYLIRVISSSPGGSSYASGCGTYFINNVYTNNFYVKIGNTLSPSIMASDTNVCNGGAVTLKAFGGTTYSWNNGDNGDSIVIRPTVDSTYVVTVGNGGCSGTDSVHISVNQAQPLPSSTQNVCSGSGVLLTVPASGSNYVWLPDSTLNTYTGDTVTANPTGNTIYTVTGLDSLGCNVTGYDTVNIIYGPNKPTITISATGDSLISSAGSYNQWYFNGSFIDSIRQVLVIKGHARGWYTVTVTNPANGCGTTSDSTTSINPVSVLSNQLSIYPNPFNNNIFIKVNSSASNINEWTLQLTDVLGRTIYSDPSLNYNNEIDLSNLPSGVYFITVLHNTARAVFPVVKQN